MRPSSPPAPLRPWLGVLPALLLLVGHAQAAESEQTPAEWLASFSDQWDEAGWSVSHGRNQPGYLRADNDTLWEARFRALQGLVAAGDAAIDPLLQVLSDGQEPERILAAQTLGFLAPNVSREALLRAIRSDRSAAVRLYAVDSLGMQGGLDLKEELTKIARSEQNGDVKKHIAYAIARGREGLDPQVAHGLVAWDAAQLNSAKLGEMAPDFTLRSLTGEAVTLSGYRGKQAVVLVFIYGDT